jgi:hypothetical protein
MYRKQEVIRESFGNNCRSARGSGFAPKTSSVTAD